MQCFAKVLRDIYAEKQAERRRRQREIILRLWRRKHMRNPLLAGVKQRQLARSPSPMAQELLAEFRVAQALLSHFPVGCEGCTCGQSFCEIHGTDHRSDERENAERRATTGIQGCGGGRRVQWKIPPA